MPIGGSRLSLTGSASAVGFTTALQFVPTLLLGLVGGLLADRHSKRTILLCTQIGMASMATMLAYLTLAHQVQAWHVFVIAFGLGIITAIDNPTRQAFVNEMVGPEQLRNAISINSSVFQLGGLIGPAVSGALISAVGPGYSFAINAVSYAAPFVALCWLREAELNPLLRATAQRGQLRDGVRYVTGRPGALWPTILVGVFGMFTANLAVTLAAYAKSVFHSGPGGYGMLSAIVAVGSLSGALISARRPHPRIRNLLVFGALLAALDLLAAAAPNESAFCVALFGIGAATLLLLTSANSTVQLASHDAIRGRVIGVYLLVFIGSAALGGPLLGTVDQQFGPRAGLLLAGTVSAFASILIATKLAHASRPTTTQQRRESPASLGNRK